MSKVKYFSKRVALLAAIAAIAVGAASVSSAAVIYGPGDCGVVAKRDTCQTALVKTSQTRCTLFRLKNGPGVKHTARLFDVRRTGTGQDVVSPRVSLNSSLRGYGENNSDSGHAYWIYQVTC